MNLILRVWKFDILLNFLLLIALTWSFFQPGLELFVVWFLANIYQLVTNAVWCFWLRNQTVTKILPQLWITRTKIIVGSLVLFPIFLIISYLFPLFIYIIFLLFNFGYLIFNFLQLKSFRNKFDPHYQLARIKALKEAEQRLADRHWDNVDTVYFHFKIFWIIISCLIGVLLLFILIGFTNYQDPKFDSIGYSILVFFIVSTLVLLVILRFKKQIDFFDDRLIHYNLFGKKEILYSEIILTRIVGVQSKRFAGQYIPSQEYVLVTLMNPIERNSISRLIWDFANFWSSAITNTDITNHDYTIVATQLSLSAEDLQLKINSKIESIKKRDVITKYT